MRTLFSSANVRVHCLHLFTISQMLVCSASIVQQIFRQAFHSASVLLYRQRLLFYAYHLCRLPEVFVCRCVLWPDVACQIYHSDLVLFRWQNIICCFSGNCTYFSSCSIAYSTSMSASLVSFKASLSRVITAFWLRIIVLIYVISLITWLNASLSAKCLVMCRFMI